MALATNALCTLQEARHYIKRKLNDDSSDPLIEDLINAASTAIHGYCHRQFKPQDAATNVAKKFVYDGSGELWFAELDTELAELTSIVLYTDQPSSSQKTLAAATATAEAEYRLEPRNKTAESTYLSLILPRLSRPRLEDYEVTVTGKWGAGSVPADVNLACRMAVATWYNRNAAAIDAGSPGGLGFNTFVTSQKEEALPSAVRLLLDESYRLVLA